MPAQGASRETFEHYFSPRPRAPSQPRLLRFLYRGEMLSFEVDRSVFAYHGLDPGTALLIESLNPAPGDSILDLGCGWGAVGVAAARAAPEGHVLLTDVNHRAVDLAKSNLRRNRIKNAEVRLGSLFGPIAQETFDLIATHPPFHAGRTLILEMLEGALKHLTPKGRLLVVGKGSQGILYYQSWLEENWAGGIRVVRRGSGYRVLEARPSIRVA